MPTRQRCGATTGTLMHDYRVYLLDTQQKISRTTWVRCGSLEEAIEEVVTQAPLTTCEVWDGPRRLATVEPQPAGRYRSH
jgi:hypothetical protein